MATRVAIALGSNLGDRVENIENAIKLMGTKGVKVLQCSHLYESAPMYYERQENFLNCACEVSKGRSRQALLIPVRSKHIMSLSSS
jgi:2-amino-4-hydroxy-6-hydroxymethyldihydropteridine diphosphokinase